MLFCQFGCLSVCLDIWMYVCLSGYLSRCLCVYCLSVYLSWCISVWISVYLNVYLNSVWMCGCMVRCLDVCISVCVVPFGLDVCMFYSCLSRCPSIFFSVGRLVWISGGNINCQNLFSVMSTIWDFPIQSGGLVSDYFFCCNLHGFQAILVTQYILLSKVIKEKQK